MKPTCFLAIVLCLFSCQATEEPNNSMQDIHGRDSAVPAPPVPAPDTMPMKDTFAAPSPKKSKPAKTFVAQPEPEGYVENVPPPEEGAVDYQGPPPEDNEPIEVPDLDEAGDYTYFGVLEPEYKGDLENFIKKNLRYPKTAKKMGVEGTIKVRFVVSKEGSIYGEPWVVDRNIGVGSGIQEEAVRVISLLPKESFKPVTIKGKPVRAYKTMLVEFKLKN